MNDAEFVTESKKYRAVCDNCSYRGLWQGDAEAAFKDANKHRENPLYQQHQMVVEEEKTLFARKQLQAS